MSDYLKYGATDLLAGGGLKSQGVWSSSSSYAANDLVSLSSGATTVYIAKNTVSSGSTNGPATRLLGGAGHGGHTGPSGNLLPSSATSTCLTVPFTVTSSCSVTTVSLYMQPGVTKTLAVGIATALGATPTASTWLTGTPSGVSTTGNYYDGRINYTLNATANLSSGTTYYLVVLQGGDGLYYNSLVSGVNNANLVGTAGFEYASGSAVAWNTSLSGAGYGVPFYLGSQVDWDVFYGLPGPVGTGGTGAGSVRFASGGSSSGVNSLAVGNNVSANGTASIAVGSTASTAGSYSAAIGTSVAASSAYSAAWGSGSTTEVIGEHRYATVNGPAVGTYGHHSLWNTTTDATPTDVSAFNNGAGVTGTIGMPANTRRNLLMRISITAARTDVAGTTFGFTWDGMIVRDAITNTAARIVGSPVTNTWADAGAAAWTVAVSTTGSTSSTDYIKITVTGEAGKTINWSGSVWFTECR